MYQYGYGTKPSSVGLNTCESNHEKCGSGGIHIGVTFSLSLTQIHLTVQ